MTSGSERRQWWAVYDNQEKQYVSIPELFVSQLLAEKYSKPFRATELKPGERVISRDELRAAWNEVMHWEISQRDSIRLIEDLMNKLFGTDTREKV